MSGVVCVLLGLITLRASCSEMGGQWEGGEVGVLPGMEMVHWSVVKRTDTHATQHSSAGNSRRAHL